MSIALSVNLNKIALIRNSRPGHYPDVTAHGKRCLDLGAHGLTVHPRPDQRHIRPDDVYSVRQMMREFSDAEFNIEGNPFASAKGSYPGLLALAEESRPDQCTLVPDSDEQATSDHGFDLLRDGERLKPIIAQLQSWGVRVSLFMDPDLKQIELAQKIGADRIELYTGPFAHHFALRSNELNALFHRYCEAAELANSLGLGVNAGHDLNLQNMILFKELPFLAEISIGHALTVESMESGLEKTISAYLNICSL